MPVGRYGFEVIVPWLILAMFALVLPALTRIAMAQPLGIGLGVLFLRLFVVNLLLAPK